MIDYAEAERFLRLLDPNARTFTFQTFHDVANDFPNKDKSLSAVIHTTIKDEGLSARYRRGAGVYVTVNRTDGKGRMTECITDLRAVWQEDDDGYGGDFPIEPSIVVESSPGHFHRYWLVEGPWPADERGRADHAAVLDRLVESYGSDNGAKGASRVLRVPGFLHRKDPSNPFMVRSASVSGRRYTRAEVLAAFPPVEQKKREPTKEKGKEDKERVRSALRSISPDDRATWIEIGMALKAEFGDEGRELWDEWAAGCAAKFDEPDQGYRWDSFKSGGIKIGTLFHRARQYGWRDERAGVREIMAEMNEDYAVVQIGGKTRVMGMDPASDGRVPLYMTVSDFKLFHDNRMVTWSSANGTVTREKKGGAGSLWIKQPHRRQYAGVVYRPGEDVKGCFNLWQGFDVEPKKGDCRLYLDHLLNNICSGDPRHYDYLLSWMAGVVQRPGQPGEVAVVLRGDEGTGKGKFANTFGKLFGPHFVAVTHARHLTGNFNAHLQRCSLLFADEAFYAGDRQHEGVLKALITEPTLQIEPKGVDPFAVPNCLHIIIASNSEWVIPAGANARRFFMLDVAEDRRQDSDYFAAIDAQMNSGGLEALLHMLLEREIAEFNVRKVPQTEALAEQKGYSARGVDALVRDIAFNAIVPAQHLVEQDVAINAGAAGKGFHEIAREMVPDLKFKSGTMITRALIKEWGCCSWHRGAQRGVRFPPLSELRRLFDNKFGPQDWPEVERWGDE